MSQKDAIRNHLEAGLSITPLQALQAYGCFRLGARIHELREEGLPVEAEQCEINHDAGVKRFARYRLKDQGAAPGHSLEGLPSPSSLQPEGG